MTMDRVMLRGIFEHERLKPTIARTNQGNVNNLAKLKQVMNTEIKLEQKILHFDKGYYHHKRINSLKKKL